MSYGMTTAVSIPQLRANLAGSVVAPGEPGYDEGRTVFYGGLDRRRELNEVAETEINTPVVAAPLALVGPHTRGSVNALSRAVRQHEDRRGRGRRFSFAH
jgi:hypothetical protein